MPVILGIDPGSRITGYGVINIQAQQIRYIDSGCIKTSADRQMPQRLMEIHQAVEKITLSYQPEDMAIEEIFLAHNPQSALKLGQARGAIIVACARQDIHIHEYAARTVKQAVVGYGNADKQQVQYMVSHLLGLNKQPSQDAADALAIALCHAYYRNNRHYSQRI